MQNELFPNLPDSPPWNEEAELSALSSVIVAGVMNSQAEVDALLMQFRPQMFFDLRNRELFMEMTKMRMEGHALDSVTLFTWLQTHRPDLQEKWPAEKITRLVEKVPSSMNYKFFLEELRLLQRRRWCLAKSAELHGLAQSADCKEEDIQNKFAELFEKSSKIGEQRALIEFVTIDEIKAYQADPKTFLIGADMVSRGELCLIAGWAGLGKSRLANTLAFAGARGNGEWMGYEIKRQFRTLVLQCENSMRRLKAEVEALPKEVNDWVKFSKPCNLAFQRPEFRAELRRICEQWPFDVLVLDHWLEIAREEGQADHMEALDNIWASLPRGDAAPALVIIVHMRKQRGGENWRPKTGRELLSEISGSYAVGAKARTVFAIQPATMEIDDDRIVFDCAKSNNDQPLPMSAWHRRNGAFIPCQEFDFSAWLNPPEEGNRKVLTEAILKTLFGDGKRRLSRRAAVQELVNQGFAEPTAYRALDLVKSKFKDFLEEKDGLLGWKG